MLFVVSYCLLCGSCSWLFVVRCMLCVAGWLLFGVCCLFFVVLMCCSLLLVVIVCPCLLLIVVCCWLLLFAAYGSSCVARCLLALRVVC